MTRLEPTDPAIWSILCARCEMATRPEGRRLIPRSPLAAVERAPYPAPIVPGMTVALDSPAVPRSARSLAGAAEPLGWRVAIFFACGWHPDAQGNPRRIVTSLSVRLERAQARRAAYWLNQAFDFAVAWGDQDLVKLNSRELRESLSVNN